MGKEIIIKPNEGRSLAVLCILPFTRAAQVANQGL